MKRFVSLVTAILLLAVGAVPAFGADEVQEEDIWITEAVYDEARNFNEGLAAVKQNGKWGFIDEQGNVAIPLEYDSVTDFNSWKEGQYYYLDKMDSGGNPILLPVSSVRQDGRSFLIDSTGAEVNPETFRVMGGGRSYSTFTENGKTGIRDWWGDPIYIPAAYDEVYERENLRSAGDSVWSYSTSNYEKTYFLVRQGSKWQLVTSNEENAPTVVAEYEDVACYGNFGYWPYFACKINGKWGFTNVDGTYFSNFAYTEVCRGWNGFGGMIYPVKTSDGKWGYIQLAEKQDPVPSPDPDPNPDPNPNPNPSPTPGPSQTEDEPDSSTDNEANSDKTTEALQKGETVNVHLGDGEGLSLETWSILGAAKDSRLEIRMGDAAFAIKGGFGDKGFDAGQSYLPFYARTQAETEIHERMMEYAKGTPDARVSTWKLGPGIRFPAAVEVSVKTKYPEGSTVFLYQYDADGKKFVNPPIALTVADGRLTYTTHLLGNVMFSDKKL